MTHTPEPWTVEDLSRSNWWIAGPQGNGWIAQVASCNRATANATRIIACVNGCAGLNPAAYQGCIETLRKIAYGNDSGLPDDMLAKRAIDQAKNMQ